MQQLLTKPQAKRATSASLQHKAIDTRFGKVTLQYDHVINFAKGMLGMSDKQHFCLLPFPVKKFPQFRLLQSLDDDQLSFITLPVELTNDIVEEADLRAGIESLEMNPEHVQCLLVVTVKREGNIVAMSVNACAPVFIDTRHSVAEQTVLGGSHRYEVTHKLSGTLAQPAS